MIEATLESYGSPFGPLMSLNAAIGEDRKSPNVNAEPPKEGADRSTGVAEVLAGARRYCPGLSPELATWETSTISYSAARRLRASAQSVLATFPNGGSNANRRR